MNEYIQLTSLDIIDLFFRFLAIGQISILIGIYISRNPGFKTYLGSTLAICFSSYVLLTAPISNEHYGFLRGIFLFFTEYIPYILWAYTIHILRGKSVPPQLLRYLYIAFTLITIWFIYFFGYLQGVGTFHKINHYIQVIPLTHIVYITLKDFADDLVTSRRNFKILLSMLASLYFLLVMIFELLLPSVKSLAYFNIVNATMIVSLTSLIAWLLLTEKLTEAPSNKSSLPTSSANEESTQIPAIYKSAFNKLNELMEHGFYTQSQLTINVLANEIEIPEHQLRELINKHIGFKNFSEYLNSYRIPEACIRFKDSNQIRTPILTTALDLGYGSIATFNRVFKQETGKTPKEYRDHFQK